MSPESLEQKIYSPATDVWAFGVVLIEIFTRKDPYPTMEPFDVRRDIIPLSINLSIYLLIYYISVLSFV